MIIAGIDEVGRGALAGPVFAAVVILDDSFKAIIRDSKQLSIKKRLVLDAWIRENAVEYQIASASVREIEQYNILQATLLAMRRAVLSLKTPINVLQVDGIHNPFNEATQHEFSVETFKKGDQTHSCIAAGSIIAKVARDRYMQVVNKYYPNYLFAKHKGYGTKAHLEQLEEHGICALHRCSFKPIRLCLEHRSFPYE